MKRERKNAQMPMFCRAMAVQSVNETDRTVELVWATETPVRQYDWWADQYFDEVLQVDDAACDLSRLNAGAPLLNVHCRYDLDDQIGVVEKAWVDNGLGYALVRFSQREEVSPIFQDVKDGIIRNVSVGYVVNKYLVEEEQGKVPVYRAVQWQPFEVSLVPVPADQNCGTRSVDGEVKPPEGRAMWPCEFERQSAEPESSNNLEEGEEMKRKQRLMNQAGDGATGSTGAPVVPAVVDVDAVRAQAVETERKRSAEVRDLAVRAGMTGTEVEALVSRGLTVEASGLEILRSQAARSDSVNVRGHSVQVTGDERQSRRDAIAAAVMHRAGSLRGDLPENAREYRGMSLAELARYSLEQEGHNVRGLSRIEVVQRSLMGTTDFANALSGALTRSLRQGYDISPRSFTPWARKGTLTDFRAVTRLQISSAALLEKVNEHGEYKSGQMAEGGEKIQLSTYGKVLGITRQAIINDDLDIFGRIPLAFAQGAVAMESAAVYGIMTGNPNMADNVALFHASHGNLAGSAAAIAIASIGAGRAAMRSQKEPSSGEPLNLQPKFLIVPAALETVAQQFISQVYLATKNSDYNPFAGTLVLIVEPRLDASSTTAWYLAADPAMVDTIEYAYLDGAEGLQTFTRDAFASGSDFDGIQVLAREDFATKAIDYRGLYKNAGA